MTGDTFLDAPLLPRFCASLEAAEQQALREAADTGGVVLRVRSLRIGHSSIVVAGLVPSGALVFEDAPELDDNLRPRSIGHLHLTWDSLLHAKTANDIGYLVLQTPVATAEDISPPDEHDLHWCALSIERTYSTLHPGCIGAVCCVRCNRPITDQRLKAIPNTRFCTACQQNKEMKDD